MALRNGIDTIAYVCGGWYSNTYTSAQGSNIASLLVSYGMLEEAPEPVAVIPRLFRWGIEKFGLTRWGFKNNWRGK